MCAMQLIAVQACSSSTCAQAACGPYRVNTRAVWERSAASPSTAWNSSAAQALATQRSLLSLLSASGVSCALLSALVRAPHVMYLTCEHTNVQREREWERRAEKRLCAAWPSARRGLGYYVQVPGAGRCRLAARAVRTPRRVPAQELTKSHVPRFPAFVRARPDVDAAAFRAAMARSGRGGAGGGGKRRRGEDEDEE